MATQASNNAAAAQGDSATLGLGGATSGQAGATPTHETQQETGGSGGEQLTHSTGEIDKAPGSRPAPAAEAPQTVPDPEGSAMQTGARGVQDTRARQAGGTGTGLGTPETGANQSEEDLPPAR
jgi:hypothetical protein